MRARLYRGPHDGRVLEVPDHQDTIKLLRRKRQNLFEDIRSGDIFNVSLSIPTVADEYRMVRCWKPGGSHVWYPSTHPDGSVFFEWTEKRGTRIKH